MLWYFGTKYLTQANVNFYKPILRDMLNKEAIPCLVDLGAWANLNKLSYWPDLGINRFHPATESLNSDKLCILKSSVFFQELVKIEKGPVFDLLKEISQRDCLLSASKNYPNIGLTFEQTVGFCPVLMNFHKEDCSKVYSLLQYLELLFLIEMIILKTDSVQTIKFILPNDEDKYYPELSKLGKDITNFIRVRLNLCKTLNIQILCFAYGKKLSQRPYLNTTQGLIDNVKKLDLDDILEAPKVTALGRIG
ncbi:MAG: hypothetical protein ACO1N3_01230 [Gammaproteobacteria bacterium]